MRVGYTQTPPMSKSRTLGCLWDAMVAEMLERMNSMG